MKVAMEMGKVIALFAALLVFVLMLELAHSFEFQASELETESSLWELYDRWSRHHKVSRDLSEKQMRFHLFKEKAIYVHEFNKKKDSPYLLELNKFSDMTELEFRKMATCSYSGHKSMQPKTITNNGLTHHRNELIKDIPDSIDWRERGVVASVKNQGFCCSCWAFSAAATIESINKIVTGELFNLSVEQLVDCDKSSNGCEGGLPVKAYAYIIESNGITTEENYPYTEKNSEEIPQKMTCQQSKVLHPLVTIDGYEEVDPNNESALKEAVAYQPVAVGIDAGSLSSQLLLYKQGIFTGPCGTDLDHAVTIVGYGTDNESGLDYWLVKNSWGAEWGEEGYFRMQRGVSAEGGLCGIAMMPAYPVKSSPTGISLATAKSSLENVI